MIRILQILPGMTYCGGIEMYLMSYYRKLDKEQIQFDFICHAHIEQRLKKEVESYGGKVYCFKPFTLKNTVALYKSVDAFFDENRNVYKIIHCHMANAAFLYFPLAKKHGINIRVLHSHQSKAADSFSHAIRNIPLLFMANQYATHRAACSKLAGDFLFKKYKFSLIYNAVDCEKFSFNPRLREELRAKYGLKGRFVIGHVGRFVPQKNHLFILSVLELVLKKKPDIVLCLFGDGELKSKIEKASKHFAGHVFFMGAKSNMNEFYNMLDLMILPSLYEGLSVAAVECQCSGLPLLASDKVSKETKLTSMVNFLPLDKLKWEQEILSMGEYCRYTHIADLSSHGYNIDIEVNSLKDYYFSLI